MLKAPFPYFGGKSTVASKVWHALGDCNHYIEPFFGSGAVLLSRPNWSEQSRFAETVNDKDGFIANVWRSLQFDPGEVSKWCDWPVNHADLAARKKELIKNENRLLENLMNNPEWFDAKLAGYWIWAASCWIGSGLTSIGQRPHVGHTGMGVHGIGKRPHVSKTGVGVHGIGKNNLLYWFNSLSDRLRFVRVVCGEWTRVTGGDWQDDLGIVGMYFDPPYGVSSRDTVYHHDSFGVAREVLLWCKDRGAKNTYRIVISGYEEYEELLSCGWKFESWSANGGYGNIGSSSHGMKPDGRGKKNKHRERLYYSPHCVKSLQRPLFIL